MWQYIIPAISVVAVAIIEALAQRERRTYKRERESMEQQQKKRVEDEYLSMQLMDANIDYSRAIAIAVIEGRTNGEMKRAREKADKAQEAYTQFIRRAAAETFERQ